MKNYIIYSVFLAMMLITLGSCRKAIPPGPQGDQGEKGEPGIEGETGPKGDKGDGGGIGNVIYSDWKFFSFTDLNTGYWRATVNEDKLTSEILNQGTTIIYFKRNGLVYKLDYLTDNASMTQRLDPGMIWLYSSWDPSDTMFRYIIIPPNQNVNLNALGKVASLDFKNYNEVCERFDIPN